MEVKWYTPLESKEDRLQWGHDKIVMEVDDLSGSDNIVGLLQWGHDKIVMEVRPPRWLKNGKDGLQWGHDKIVMEVILHTTSV